MADFETFSITSVKERVAYSTMNSKISYRTCARESVSGVVGFAGSAVLTWFHVAIWGL